MQEARTATAAGEARPPPRTQTFCQRANSHEYNPKPDASEPQLPNSPREDDADEPTKVRYGYDPQPAILGRVAAAGLRGSSTGAADKVPADGGDKIPITEGQETAAGAVQPPGLEGMDAGSTPSGTPERRQGHQRPMEPRAITSHKST